jgi:hypothetical protein
VSAFGTAPSEVLFPLFDTRKRKKRSDDIAMADPLIAADLQLASRNRQSGFVPYKADYFFYKRR